MRNGWMNQRHFGGKLSSSLYYAVPDPDLEMGGGGHPDPLMGGGGVVSEKIFSGPSGLSLV